MCVCVLALCAQDQVTGVKRVLTAAALWLIINRFTEGCGDVGSCVRRDLQQCLGQRVEVI